MQLITTTLLLSLLVSSSAFMQAPHHAFIGFSRQHQTTMLFAEEVDEITLETEDRMSKSVDSVKINMNTIRTGRASPAILDRVKADYYGAETPINQMATISVPSAQQLTVDPYDKSSLADIEKAIIEAGIGLTPQNDGNIIRLNIPDLTEERRKEMLKQCKAIGEEGKVAVRNIRRDGVDKIKKLEKSGDIGEDEMKDGTDEVQKLTDKAVKEIGEFVSSLQHDVCNRYLSLLEVHILILFTAMFYLR
jgi:ribosome recycling factor